MAGICTLPLLLRHHKEKKTSASQLMSGFNLKNSLKSDDSLKRLLPECYFLISAFMENRN